MKCDQGDRDLTLHAGIDAGGTSFKCGLFDDAWKQVSGCRVPVTTPDETIQACIDFFKTEIGSSKLPATSFGVASFGPLEVDSASPRYGTILATPKPGWSDIPLRHRLEDGLGQPVVIDTDVNGALLAELSLGAAIDCQSAAYVTVGTGIGAGIFSNGDFIGRPSHPEFGHIPVRRFAGDENFVSVCPFHNDCLEGLASAKAFEARFGLATELPPNHSGWMLEADYLAQACQTLYLTFRLERIILGGGLPQADALISSVRAVFLDQLGGYAGLNSDDADALIRPSHFGDEAGVMGAALLGSRVPN